jgi:hypothetical protein
VIVPTVVVELLVGVLIASFEITCAGSPARRCGRS